jgi:hypothetical protein
LGDEAFNLTVSPTSSDEEDPEVDLDFTTARQQRQESRASGPAGNRRAHVAADTLTFFNIEGDQKTCKFCL